MYSPHLRRGDLCSPSWKVDYLGKICGILLHERFVVSFLFIYSSKYLHQYGLMDIDFILWVESLFCFVLFFSKSSGDWWEVVQLAPGSFDVTHHCGF